MQPHAIYTRIRDLIVRGRLPPGARLAEGALADWLGVSRTPIREAIQRLKHERLLVSVGGGSGIRDRVAVAPLTRDRMLEVYHLAAALEGMAGRGLALRGPNERSELANRLEAVEQGDAFHHQLMEPCAGPETQAMLEAIWPQIERYEWFCTRQTRDHKAASTERGAIVRAVRGGLASEIEQAIRSNWINSADRLAPIIKNSSGALLFAASQQMLPSFE